MKKLALLILVFVIFFNIDAKSQGFNNPEPPLNRAWVKEHAPNKDPVPYVHLREADVMWAKRIWRDIDLREKMNHPLYYPVQPVRDRISLTQVLWDAVTEGSLTAYADEDFTQPKTPSEVIAENTQTDTQTMTIMGRDTTIISTEEFNAANVRKIRITEDWYFDRQRSMLDVRILSICPLVETFTVDPVTGEKTSKGFKALFYIHYPSSRNILVKKECFNRHNDAARLSYDDIFWKRMFDSIIIKEENVYDRFIDEYHQGLDALLEAEKIKDQIRNYEHDQWSF